MLVSILIVFGVVIILWLFMTRKVDDFVVSNITHIAGLLTGEEYVKHVPSSEGKYFTVAIIDALDYLIKKDISINDLLAATAMVHNSTCSLGSFHEEIDVVSYGFEKNDKLFVLALQLKLMFDLVNAGNDPKFTFENVMKKKSQIANQIKRSRNDYQDGKTPIFIKKWVAGFFKSDKLKEYRGMALDYDLAQSKFSVFDCSLSRFFRRRQRVRGEGFDL